MQTTKKNILLITLCRGPIRIGSSDDFCLFRVENIVGKGENAGFQRYSSNKSSKLGIVCYPFPKRQNLRPVQFEMISRRQYNCDSKIEIYL